MVADPRLLLRYCFENTVSEIFYTGDGTIKIFLDIRSRVLELGTSSGGYDERGFLWMAFHPEFYYNGLFYIHYSVAGTQGPGALPGDFTPNPCDPQTLNLKWINRETQYDHILIISDKMILANASGCLSQYTYV